MESRETRKQLYILEKLKNCKEDEDEVQVVLKAIEEFDKNNFE